MPKDKITPTKFYHEQPAYSYEPYTSKIQSTIVKKLKSWSDNYKDVEQFYINEDKKTFREELKKGINPEEIESTPSCNKEQITKGNIQEKERD